MERSRELDEVEGIVIEEKPSERCSDRRLQQKGRDCAELAGTEVNKFKAWELTKGLWKSIRGTEVVARKGELLKGMQISNGLWQMCELVVV